MKSPELASKQVIIFDDLCDGGGTFIGAVAPLKEKGAEFITLAITHGLFSKGVDCLIEGGISHIITTNSYQDQIEHPSLTTHIL